jgi:hypothetical protein
MLYSLNDIFLLQDCIIYFHDVLPALITWPRFFLNISDLCLRGVRVMMFNATFNNISGISWQYVLLVEETGVPIENHRLVASH